MPDRVCLYSRMCQKAWCRRPNHSVLRPGSCYPLFPWLDNESIVRHSTITSFSSSDFPFSPILHLFCFVLLSRSRSLSLPLSLSVLFFTFLLSISFSVRLSLFNLNQNSISTLSFTSLSLTLSVSVSLSSPLRSIPRN